MFISIKATIYCLSRMLLLDSENICMICVYIYTHLHTHSHTYCESKKNNWHPREHRNFIAMFK